MGKSLGNGILLRQIFSEGHPLLEQTFEPAVVRHFILTSHYRAPLDFSNEALRAAQSGSHRLRDLSAELARAALRAPEASPAEAVRDTLADIPARFAEAMNDDFNTAAAIAVLFEFARAAGGWLRGGVGRQDLLAADTLMQRLVRDALGFRWQAGTHSSAGEEERNRLIGLLAELRAQAKQEKNFALSDQIRARLGQLGIELRDTPTGTQW
jgi:cysteinyl-tRNA synthetase